MAAESTKDMENKILNDLESDLNINNDPEILISIKMPLSQAMSLIGQITGQAGSLYVSPESQKQYIKHFAKEDGTA